MLKPRRSWLDWITLLLFILSFIEALGMFIGGILHGNDFKHLWLGAYLLDYGRSPYNKFSNAAGSYGFATINPFVYLPTTGLMMRPLAWLSFGPAMLVWFWFNWLLAWGMTLWGPTLLRVERPALARLAGAVFLAGAMPFMRQMTAGQMNVVAAALILWGAVALARRKCFQAGLTLALGFAWKIAPALLIAACAGLRKWRAAAWGAGLSILFLLISLMIYGVSIHREALDVIRQMKYGQSTWSERGNDFYRDPANQSPNSLMHHLLTENRFTKPWITCSAETANNITVIISFIIVLLWTERVWRLIFREKLDGAIMPLFLAASLAMLLLPSLMWDHYMVQALPALLWVFGRSAVVQSPWRMTAALLILTMLCMPLFYSEWREGAGILVMSLRLWPVLGLYLWLLYDRKNSV